MSPGHGACVRGRGAADAAAGRSWRHPRKLIATMLERSRRVILLIDYDNLQICAARDTPGREL